MPNTSSLPLGFVPEYPILLALFELEVVWWKASCVCLATWGKPFLFIRPSLVWAFPDFVCRTLLPAPERSLPLRWFPGVLVLRADFPFNKVTKFLEVFVTSSNLPPVNNNFTLHDFFYLLFEVSFDIFWNSYRLFSSFPHWCSVRFQ